MANTKSALKAIRVSERKRTRNTPIKSSLKTLIRKAERSITVGQTDAAAAAVANAISALDKAAGKGVIHGNSAARRKSRLMAKYNKVSAGS